MTSPNWFLVLMVTVATVTGEVVLATALTFAAFFSDLSVLLGLIQSFPSSEWMDVSVVHRAHNRMKSTAVLAFEIFWYKPWTVHLLFFFPLSFLVLLFILISCTHTLSLSYLFPPAVHLSVLQRAICDCAWPWALHARVRRAMCFGLLYKLCYIWWGNNKLWQLADLRPCPKTLGAVEVCVSIAGVQDKWAGGSGSKKAQ